MLRAILILIPIAVTIYALVDVVATPADDTRTLPKWAWAVLVALVWFVGAILWFVLGRPRRQRGGGNRGGSRPEQRPLGPDDDPNFLSELERRKRNHDPKLGPDPNV